MSGKRGPRRSSLGPSSGVRPGEVDVVGDAAPAGRRACPARSPPAALVSTTVRAPGPHRGAHRVGDHVRVVALVEVDPAHEGQDPPVPVADRADRRCRGPAPRPRGTRRGRPSGSSATTSPMRSAAGFHPEPEHDGHVVALDAGGGGQGGGRGLGRLERVRATGSGEVTGRVCRSVSPSWAPNRPRPTSTWWASATPSSTSSAPKTTTFIDRLGMAKGSMTLIDTDRAEELYAAMGEKTETSGGSAANTLVRRGRPSAAGPPTSAGSTTTASAPSFAHDLNSLGVHFDSPRATDGRPHRALHDHRHPRRRAHHEHLPRRVGHALRRAPRPRPHPLGARSRSSRATCSTAPEAKEAFRLAAETAHDAGRKVVARPSRTASASSATATTSSSWSAKGVDILFANEEEITKLFGVDSFEAGVDAVGASARSPRSPRAATAR